MRTGTAVVIGAGIGGLAAARGLARQGWRVRVLERAAAIEPVGAGLAIAPNALRGLDTLGVGDAVRERAAFGSGGIRRWSGGWLLTTDVEMLRRRFGDTVVVLRRSEVLDLLRADLPAGALRTGTQARITESGGDRHPARVVASDAVGGEEETAADLVVAADGARSGARATLFPDHPGLAYAGFTTWRFLTAPGTAATLGVRLSAETWGPGGVVGVMLLADEAVSVYATLAAPPEGRETDERAALLRRFGDWHAPIPTVMAAADRGAVLRNDVWHLPTPLPAMHRGRVALLGDAAHPMAPSLGQGACQAVEDAVTLASVARLGAGEIPALLAGYTASRLPRTTKVVRRSARVGRMTHMWSRPLLGLRDATLATVGRYAPPLFYGPLHDTFGWSPPEDAAPG